MMFGASSQILLQPWLERRLAGKLWLTCLLLAATLILPMITFALLGVQLALVAFVGLTPLLVLMCWGIVSESTLKQNTISNSRLVPGFTRRLVGTMLASYLLCSLVMGVAISLVYRRFLGEQWHGGGIVAVVALTLAGYLLLMRNRFFSWALVLILLGGSRIDLVAGADYSILGNDSSQLALAAIALTAGSIVMAFLYGRPRDANGEWTVLGGAGAGGGRRASPFLYRRALQRAIEKKDRNALVAYAMGPVAHWTNAVYAGVFMLAASAFLMLMGNSLLWLLLLTMPLLSSSASAEALLDAAHKTRAEQNLLLLAPGTLRGETMNRSLLSSYATTFAASLFITLICCLPLWMFAPAPDSKQIFATLAIVSSLPPALWIATDYARLRGRTMASIIAPLSAGLTAAAAVWVTHTFWPHWVPAAAMLLIAVTGALFALRWRQAIRAPSFFAAGRLTST